MRVLWVGLALACCFVAIDGLGRRGDAYAEADGEFEIESGNRAGNSEDDELEDLEDSQSLNVRVPNGIIAQRHLPAEASSTEVVDLGEKEKKTAAAESCADTESTKICKLAKQLCRIKQGEGYRDFCTTQLLKGCAKSLDMCTKASTAAASTSAASTQSCSHKITASNVAPPRVADRKLLGAGNIEENCHSSCCECHDNSQFGCTQCGEDRYLKVLIAAGGKGNATVSRGMCLEHTGLGDSCAATCLDHKTEPSEMLPASTTAEAVTCSWGCFMRSRLLNLMKMVNGKQEPSKFGSNETWALVGAPDKKITAPISYAWCRIAKTVTCEVATTKDSSEQRTCKTHKSISCLAITNTTRNQDLQKTFRKRMLKDPKGANLLQTDFTTLEKEECKVAIAPCIFVIQNR